MALSLTRDEFEEKFTWMLEKLENADFLAIDTEFSGINTDGKSKKYFDLQQTKYEGMREVCQKYDILQFGIATFTYNATDNKYNVEAFNFYLWPSFSWKSISTICFEISSYRFLKHYNFDFQKCLDKGIEYTSLEYYEKMKNMKITDINVKYSFPCDVVKNYYATIRDGLRDWLLYNPKIAHYENECPFEHPYELILLLKLIYDDFGRFVSPEFFDKKLTLTRCDSGADTLPMFNDIYQKCILQMYGFGRIISHIVKMRKPIIGHNSLYDLMFMYEKYIGSLPKPLDQFSRKLVESFPQLYDTKYISEIILKKIICKKTDLPSSTNLKVLFDYMNSDFINSKLTGLSKILTPYGDPSDKDNVFCHDAAYDATMTGIVFLKLSQLFCQSFTLHNEINQNPAHLFTAMLKLGNKVHLGNDYKKYIDFNVNVTDELPALCSVLFITKNSNQSRRIVGDMRNLRFRFDFDYDKNNNVVVTLEKSNLSGLTTWAKEHKLTYKIQTNYIKDIIEIVYPPSPTACYYYLGILSIVAATITAFTLISKH